MPPSLAFALLALSALPPQSEDELKDSAEVIVVGVVQKVVSKEVKVEDGTNHEYSATLKIVSVEKTVVASKAKTITVHFRRTGKRPPGWTGPAGQSSLFKKGDRVRIFATIDGETKKLELLEPNGWEPVASAARKP